MKKKYIFVTIVAVIVVFLFLVLAPKKPKTEPPIESPGAPTDQQTSPVSEETPVSGETPRKEFGKVTLEKESIKYLIFQIFTYPQPFVITEGVVRDIVETIGEKGTKNRRLGFTVGPITLEHSDAELRNMISGSFDIARKQNVAVMFHFDDSMFWKTRDDLWSKHENIEWTSWDGEEVGPRVIGWFGQELAPQMCYNSEEMRQELKRRIREVAAPEIVKGIKRLKGKEELFGGIIVGWETRLDDDNPDSGQVGYCALTNKGFRKENPPEDMDKELEKIVHEFIEFWAKEFVNAGISKDKIYTHFQVSENYVHTPSWTAFNDYSHAGFSVYTHNTFNSIYEELDKQEDKIWGISEGSNFALQNAFDAAGTRSDISWENYLAKAYNHGASYAVLFGWQGEGSEFQEILLQKSSLETFREFLRGEELVE